MGPEEPGSLSEQHPPKVEVLTEEQLGNIVSGLENGPNLRELTWYWAAVGARHPGAAGLPAAGKGGVDDREPAAGVRPAEKASGRPAAGSAH